MPFGTIKDLWETAESGAWDSAYSKDFRQQDFKRERRWTKQFKCWVDSGDEDPDTTLGNCQASADTFITNYSAGLDTFPLQWSPHPNDPDMVAVEFRVRVQGGDEGPQFRTIEVLYELATSPLTEKAVVVWDSNSYARLIPGAFAPSPLAEPLPLTADGYVPLTNTAGDSFNPPPVWQEPYRVLKVSKNFSPPAWATMEQAFTVVQSQQMLVTNSIAFNVKLPDNTQLNYPAGNVLLDTHPHAENQYRNNVNFVRAQFTFKISGRSWAMRILNAGFNSTTFNELVPIYVGGRAAVNPQLLGQADGFGNVGVLPAGQAPIYLPYVVYREFDMNLFGLFP